MPPDVPPDQRDRQDEWRSHHRPVPPEPTAPELEAAARSVVFFANVTADSTRRFLALPPRWTASVTADPAYQSTEARLLILEAKDAGRPPRPWCDCREPDGDPKGTPFRAALEMAATYGLPEPIGQCESPVEYDHARQAGARILIGNPTALSPEQRRDATAAIAAGTLAIIGEMYRPDPGYSAMGVPIASVCYGVALDAGQHTPVSVYVAASSPAERDTFCVYHAAGLADEDWSLLR